MHIPPPRTAALALLLAVPAFAQAGAPAAATIDDTRVALGKWIETQQILSKERKDWQQGKEILTSRIDLLKKEVADLAEKIKAAEAAAALASQKQAELVAEKDKLVAMDARLVDTVAGMEGEVRKLFPALPESLQTKVAVLFQRMPTAATTVRVSAAERFQNVLVILGEVNKQNSEITVDQEVRTMPDGKRTEVQAIYIGLGQAYYVSSGGLAGIGRPTEQGWKWEPMATIGRQVLAAVEILQGKQTPAYVPLPVRLQ